MKRFFVSIFMVISMLLNAVLPAVAIDTKEESLNTQFSANISCTETGVDLSNIEIKVYSAIATYTDDTAGYTEYTEVYAFSVYTNGAGLVTFDRPSECFSITVNLATLPTNYGIDRHTCFFESAITEYTGYVSRVSSVDIEYEGNEAMPVLYDAGGKALYANVQVEESDSANTAGSVAVSASKNQITYEKKYTVKVYDEVYTVIKDITYEYVGAVDKAQYLFDKKIISEYEYINQLSSYVLNGNAEKTNGVDEIDGTALYWQIRNYYESNSDKKADMSKIKKALDFFAPESTESMAGQVYVTSDSGYFRVYYTSGEITSNVAKAVANVFDDIDALFCSSWGLRRPYYDETSSYYKVYLVNTTSYDGTTPRVGMQGSYIQLSNTVAEHIYNSTGVTGYPKAYQGVAAHEYMHAIFYRYGIMYDTTDRMWMHEAFATWSGIAFESDYAAKKTHSVNIFLNSAWQPMTYYDGNHEDYVYRRGGSCVFPLYIEQEMGGYTTIKKIIEMYSNSNDPFTAINAGLEYYGYSFEEAYSACTAYNYDPGYFYDNAISQGNKKWETKEQSSGGSIYVHNEYPYSSNVTHGIQKLACHYAKFQASSDTNSTLTVTIDYTGLTGEANAVLKTIRTGAGGTKYISDCTISNNRCTIVQQNFGSQSASEIAIVPVNTGVSGMVSYTKTANIY